MKTIITASDKSVFNFTELKRYSGLFKYLSLRDIFVRYKQTWVGFGWSVIRPLINILIFGGLSFLIDTSQNFTDNFLWVSAGVVFWQLISSSISDVSASLAGNANILTKVYFPKLILPFSSMVVGFIDFLISFFLFIICFSILKGFPPWQILFLPLVLIYTLIFCFSFGLIFAAASVKYRDVRFVLPFIIQILFYGSPVFIKAEVILRQNIPEFLKIIYQVNPLFFILNSFKYCIYGQFDNFNPVYTLISILITIIILIVSMKYFLNFEKSFADYI